MSYDDMSNFSGFNEVVVLFLWNGLKKVINFYLDLVEVVLEFVFLNLIILYVVDNEQE